VSPVVRIVLSIAYAILCLAATGRSVFQITTKFAEAPVPYTISAVSAVLYGVIAFALWTRRMRLALAGTVVELAGVIIVGTLGWLEPSWWADETVWTGYGSAYGWVPLALPVIALWLLLRERRSSTTT
jgi:hypothetical protein